MNKKTNNKGFSLVELIIVIAIMAILVGVLAPQFIKYVEASRQSTDISAASEYRAAVEAYVAEKGGTDTPVDSNIDVKISTTGIYADGIDLSDIGLSAGSTDTETKFKSGGWGAAKTIATYNITSFKWTPVSPTVNSKPPAKDLSAAFK